MTPRRAALSAAALLAAAAAPHAAWASGASWPADDPASRDDLALPPFLPGAWNRRAYGGVALGLAAATGHLLAQAGVLPEVLDGRTTRRLTRLLSTGIAGRGLLGLVTSAPRLRAGRRYAPLDVALYSPLCLALAVLVRRAGDHGWS